MRTHLISTALTALAAAASAQEVQNDTPLSNGGDILFIPFTTSAPGDLYWRALPGDRVLAHQHGPAGSATMELSGFYEDLWDSDWSTTPHFFDRHVGHALPVIGAPCALEPDFLQTGVMTGTTITLGPSGFGPPCTVAPSVCSPATTGSYCAAPGFLLGWIMDVSLGSSPGSGVVVPADGTPASDVAVTYFITPGMPVTGGTCSSGDFVLQTSYSTDETQADDCGGLSAFSGSGQSGGAALQDPVTDTPDFTLAWREPMLNVVADSGTGLGIEHGENGGGALNGLKLDTQSGLATIGVEVRDLEGVGDLVFAWSTIYAGGPPGFPQGGAWLLQRFNRSMPACFFGTVAATTFVFTPEGAFATCQMPLQAVAAGPVDFYWQALMSDPLTGALRNTNRVRTTLY
jgi:hypothetical protein